MEVLRKATNREGFEQRNGNMKEERKTEGKKGPKVSSFLFHVVPSSDGLQPSSFLFLVAIASTLVAMAST